MTTEEDLEVEELAEEGFSLANAGLSHLRKLLAKEPVETLEVFAWNLTARIMVRNIRLIATPPLALTDLALNLEWLSERLTPKAPDGQPFDFVVSNSTD